jgi:hypothetical protein
MIKCLENHKHLIFLKQEQWLLSKFLFKPKVKIRVLHLVTRVRSGDLLVTK